MTVPATLPDAVLDVTGSRAGPVRRFFRHPTGVVGLAIVVFFVAISLLAPVLRPYDASRDRDLSSRLAPPSAEHWFGADELVSYSRVIDSWIYE